MKKQEPDYERLPEVCDVPGCGIPNLKARLIQRTDEKALYLRNDKVWDVFKIEISPEVEAFGKTYPKRETYPGIERFGVVAWNYFDEGLARERYDSI